MKRNMAKEMIGGGSAVAMAMAVAAAAVGQDLAPGEVIVGSRVISDVPVGSHEGVATGEIAGPGGMTGVGRGYGQPDLFYNYYTQGYANQTNAQMYVSPQPVPPNVGHTYLTYQPFYPHESLYWHKNRFHNYYDNGRGMNRTRATYYSPPVRQAVSNLYWNYLRLPR